MGMATRSRNVFVLSLCILYAWDIASTVLSHPDHFISRCPHTPTVMLADSWWLAVLSLIHKLPFIKDYDPSLSYPEATTAPGWWMQMYKRLILLPHEEMLQQCCICPKNRPANCLIAKYDLPFIHPWILPIPTTEPGRGLRTIFEQNWIQWSLERQVTFEQGWRAFF